MSINILFTFTSLTYPNLGANQLSVQLLTNNTFAPIGPEIFVDSSTTTGTSWVFYTESVEHFLSIITFPGYIIRCRLFQNGVYSTSLFNDAVQTSNYQIQYNSANGKSPKIDSANMSIQNGQLTAQMRYVSVFSIAYTNANGPSLLVQEDRLMDNIAGEVVQIDTTTKDEKRQLWNPLSYFYPGVADGETEDVTGGRAELAQLTGTIPGIMKPGNYFRTPNQDSFNAQAWLGKDWNKPPDVSNLSAQDAEQRLERWQNSQDFYKNTLNIPDYSKPYASYRDWEGLYNEVVSKGHEEGLNYMLDIVKQAISSDDYPADVYHQIMSATNPVDIAELIVSSSLPMLAPLVQYFGVGTTFFNILNSLPPPPGTDGRPFDIWVRKLYNMASQAGQNFDIGPSGIFDGDWINANPQFFINNYNMVGVKRALKILTSLGVGYSVLKLGSNLYGAQKDLNQMLQVFDKDYLASVDDPHRQVYMRLMQAYLQPKLPSDYKIQDQLERLFESRRIYDAKSIIGKQPENRLKELAHDVQSEKQKMQLVVEKTVHAMKNADFQNAQSGVLLYQDALPHMPEQTIYQVSGPEAQVPPERLIPPPINLDDFQSEIQENDTIQGNTTFTPLYSNSSIPNQIDIQSYLDQPRLFLSSMYNWLTSGLKHNQGQLTEQVKKRQTPHVIDVNFDIFKPTNAPRGMPNISFYDNGKGQTIIEPYFRPNQPSLLDPQTKTRKPRTLGRRTKTTKKKEKKEKGNRMILLPQTRRLRPRVQRMPPGPPPMIPGLVPLIPLLGPRTVPRLGIPDISYTMTETEKKKKEEEEKNDTKRKCKWVEKIIKGKKKRVKICNIE